MIGDRVSSTESSFAFANNSVHLDDVFKNFRDNLFAGHATRADAVGRFAPSGEVAKSGND